LKGRGCFSDRPQQNYLPDCCMYLPYPFIVMWCCVLTPARKLERHRDRAPHSQWMRMLGSGHFAALPVGLQPGTCKAVLVLTPGPLLRGDSHNGLLAGQG